MRPVIIIRPKYYPHWGRYAYTRRGFERTQVPRLRRLGFGTKVIDRLRELYFCSHSEHQNDLGDYPNLRQYRLHAMSREVFKGDRKASMFGPVVDSGLFVVMRWGDTREIAGFRSPRETLPSPLKGGRKDDTYARRKEIPAHAHEDGRIRFGMFE